MRKNVHFILQVLTRFFCFCKGNRHSARCNLKHICDNVGNPPVKGLCGDAVKDQHFGTDHSGRSIILFKKAIGISAAFAKPISLPGAGKAWDQSEVDSAMRKGGAIFCRLKNTVSDALKIV